MTMTNDDALSELCAAERGTEVPPSGAADMGWQRLRSELWPGPDGGDGGDGADGGDAPGGAQPVSTAAAGSSGAAAGGLSTAVKIAAALCVAAAVGVGIAIGSSPEPGPTRPSIAAATADDATPEADAEDDRPALRAADPEPPQPAPPIVATGALPDPLADPQAPEPAPASPEPAPASSVPSQRTAALPDVPGVGLAHEVAILREASAALAAGKPAAALRWTRRHAADHPDGSLTEERLATEAIARCQLHDRRARASSDRFLQRYPRSTHESRVRAACERVSP